MTKQTKRAADPASADACTVVLLAVVLCDTVIHGVPLKAGSIAQTDAPTAEAHAHELDAAEAAVTAKQSEFPGLEPIEALPAINEVPTDGEQGEA